MSQSTKRAKDAKALPLSDTLRDLALLRASDVDLAGLLPPDMQADRSGDAGSVPDSSEFIKEARVALRLHDRGEAGMQGKKLEDVRTKFEELLEGLS